MLDYSYMSIRRIRLMHLLFVTQILDYHCLTTEVERLARIVHRMENIISEDTKIIGVEQARNQERIGKYKPQYR